MPAISSKEYWEKRSELNLIQNEKSASQYERQLKKAYEETVRSIRKEVQAFYQRHSDETGVTLTSARRRLKPDEQLDFQKQARKYLAEVERLGDKAFTAEYRGYLKKLSGRAYISQMDELVTNIRHNIETLSTGYNTGLGNTLKYAYEDGYYRTMFDAQKQAHVGVSFTAPGDKQLETAIREKWLGQNYSDRIWTDKKKLTDNIEQMLSQEFVRGRGPNEIARDFADRLNVSYSNAQRLIRTEINYISNKGSLQAYKDTGIVEKYRYLATLDSRTSDICRELDGEVFEIKEAKVGVNLPPLHPYCRSTTVPHFDDDDIGELIEDRIARDDDGKGRSVRLGENLRFFDWVDKYGSESFKKKVTAQRVKFKGMDILPQEVIETEEVDDGFKPLDEKEIKRLNSKLKEFKEFEGEINEILDNAGPEYQRMFYKTAMKLKTISNFDPERGAYYRSYGHIPGYTQRGSAINISLESEKTSAANYSISPLAALFHEIGHAIDDKMGRGKSGLHGTKKYKFVKAMKKDLSKLLDRKGDLYADAVREFGRDNKTGGIQDILSGAKYLSEDYDNHSIPITWKHSDAYWKRGDTTDEMASELFAYLNTTFVDKDYADIYNKYMPESMKAFNTILEDVYNKLK